MSDTSRLNLTLLPAECFALIAQNYSLESLIELAKNSNARNEQEPMVFSDGKPLGLDSKALAQKLRLQPNEKELIRTGALQVLKEHLQVLIQNNVHLIGKPGHDEPHLILEQTLQEQKREIAELLSNGNNSFSATQKVQLNTAASIESTYVGDIIEIDDLLNTVNMTLAQPRLDAYEAAPEEQELHLSKIGLTRLSEELIVKLQSYPVLTKLDLSYNLLSTLPDSFGNLVGLTKLDLSHNKLTTLPHSFGDLIELIILFTSYNQLVLLPTSFGNLVALTALNLNNNELATLPDSFGDLGALTWLWMENNPLISLPESIRQTLTQAYNENLFTSLTPVPVYFEESNESDDDIFTPASIYTPRASTKKQAQKRRAEETNVSPQNSAAAKEQSRNKKPK